MKKSVGHVDYFPNGGSKQPGCYKTVSDLSCSHSKATAYFESSLSSKCKFYAYRCNSWNEFDNNTCEAQAASVMGFYADTIENVRGNFYLRTTADYPYCFEQLV